MEYDFNSSIESLYLRINELHAAESPQQIKKLSRKIDRSVTLLSQQLLTEKPPPSSLGPIVATRQLLSIDSSKIDPELKKKIVKLIEIFDEKLIAIQPPSTNNSFDTNDKKDKNGPYLNLFFGCDFDLIDHNGAIISNCLDCLEQKVPVLITRSLLFSENIKDSSEKKRHISRALEILGRDKYEIFQHQAGELVLLLPKGYLFKKEQLGINFTHLERQTSFSSFVKNEQKNLSSNNLQSVEEIFDKQSSTPKRILLNGHGSRGKIAALEAGRYHRLLQLFNEIHTEVLAVNSCYAGGANILDQIAFNDKTDSSKQVDFPIIIQSLGGFVTYSGKQNQFFTSVDSALKSYPSVKNPLYKTVFESEKATNRMQLYFPHHTQESQGFVPLSNKEKIYTLTPLEVKKKRVEQRRKSEQQLLTIALKDKEVVAISPAILQADLILQSASNQFTFLHHTLPGSSHLLIDTLTLPCSLSDFFAYHAQFFIRERGEDTKALFVGHLRLDSETKAEQVVIKLDGAFPECYYRDSATKKCYYLRWDGSGLIKPQEVTSLQHALSIENVRKKTIPSQDALQMGLNGKEEESSFQSELHRVFWEDGLPSVLRSYLDYQRLDGEDKEKAENIYRLITPLDRQGRQDLLLIALQNGEIKLAEGLLEGSEINVNIKNEKGFPLINLAIQANALSVVEKLLEKNADLNSSDSYGTTPLMLALGKNQEEIISLLLKNKEKIRLSATDYSGFNLLFYAASFQLQKMVVEELHVDIDRSANGSTLLSLAAEGSDIEKVKSLLKLGADVNKGSPTPLECAVKNNNLELITLLINHKAQSTSAILNGAAMASQRALELILEQKQWSEKELSTAAFLAFSFLRFNNIALLVDKGAVFNKDFIDFILRNYSEKMVVDFFEILFSGKPNNGLIESTACTLYLFYPQLLDAFLKQSDFDLSTLRSSPERSIEEVIALLALNQCANPEEKLNVLLKILKTPLLKDPKTLLKSCPLQIPNEGLYRLLMDSTSSNLSKNKELWTILLSDQNSIVQQKEFDPLNAKIIKFFIQQNDKELIGLCMDRFFDKEKKLLSEKEKMKLLEKIVDIDMGNSFWKNIISNQPHLISEELVENFLEAEATELIHCYIDHADKEILMENDELWEIVVDYKKDDHLFWEK